MNTIIYDDFRQQIIYQEICKYVEKKTIFNDKFDLSRVEEDINTCVDKLVKRYYEFTDDYEDYDEIRKYVRNELYSEFNDIDELDDNCHRNYVYNVCIAGESIHVSQLPLFDEIRDDHMIDELVHVAIFENKTEIVIHYMHCVITLSNLEVIVCHNGAPM